MTSEQCPICGTRFISWEGGDTGLLMVRHFGIDQEHRRAAQVSRRGP